MTDSQVRITGIGPGASDRLMTSSQVVDGLVKLLEGGQVDEAVRVYSRCSVDVGFQLMNSVTSDGRIQKLVANMLFRARDYAKAAEVCERLGEWDKAAGLYEKADDVYLAGEMYARAGNFLRAAAMYERGGNLKEAAKLYDQQGEKERAADCYRRTEDFFEAGRLYHALGKAPQAVELLQRVPAEHPGYEEATLALAELLLQTGYPQLAEKKLRSVAPQVDGKSVGVWYAIADVYARSGAATEAKELLSEILEHDVQYRDAADRLQQLERGEGPSTPLTVEVQKVDEAASADDAVVGVDASLDFLARLPLFEELSLDDVRALATIAEPRDFAEGEVLIEQGAPGEALFVITKGTVTVTRSGETERLLATLPAGAHVGEMALIDDAPTSARVQAVEDGEALALPMASFRHLLESRPGLSLRIHQVLSRTLCRRLRATGAKLAN